MQQTLAVNDKTLIQILFSCAFEFTVHRLLENLKTLFFKAVAF